MTPALPRFFDLIRLDRIDSTSEEAIRRAEAGAAEGLLILAAEQTAGRGRQGRVWQSPPGNLYCTVLLRPRVTPAAAAGLSFVAALAVAEAVAGFAPAGAVTCKWPNDVLLGGAKVAGILLESRSGPGGGLDWITIGAGINVASHPAGLDRPVTALADHGAHCRVDDVLAAYAPRLLHWYAVWQAQGFAPIRAAWLSRADGLGQRMRVRLGTEDITGVFETLDASGAMVLSTAAGRRTVTAGEVFRAA